MSGRLGRAAGIFLRGLFVQASWSFQRMQSPGYFLMRAPSLARRHAPGSPAWTQAALADLQTFNTHPYLAGLVAGTVAREEEGGAEGASVAAGLKRSLMCSLGGVGDEFFWAHARPAAALLALLFALAGASWAAVVLLVAYNVPHLALRGWGAFAGLARGREIVTVLQRRPLARSLPALAAAITAFAGAAVALAGQRAPWQLVPGDGAASLALAVAAFLGLLLPQLRGLSFGRLLAAASVAALLAGAARAVVTA